MRHRWFSLISLVVLLAACSAPPSSLQPDPSQPPGFRYTPLPTVLAAPGGQVTTAGYYYSGGDGAVLVEGLSFAGDGPVPLLDEANQQVWLGAASSPELEQGLRSSGAVRYAPLLVSGRIEGPGSFGPGGRYPFQLTSPSFTLLVPTTLTVTGLLAKAFSYDGQFVRVKGMLLANEEGALLADELSKGGVPTVASRQLKLAEPVRDARLLAWLTASAGGAARYGPVEVEGFWRNGELLALGIVPNGR